MNIVHGLVDSNGLFQLVILVNFILAYFLNLEIISCMIYLPGNVSLTGNSKVFRCWFDFWVLIYFIAFSCFASNVFVLMFHLEKNHNNGKAWIFWYWPLDIPPLKFWLITQWVSWRNKEEKIPLFSHDCTWAIVAFKMLCPFFPTSLIKPTGNSINQAWKVLIIFIELLTILSYQPRNSQLAFPQSHPLVVVCSYCI